MEAHLIPALINNDLLETHDRIAYLQYSSKYEKLICSAPFRLNIGPAFDKYMEWGFIDGSVRFYAADTKKVYSPTVYCQNPVDK